MTTRIIEVFATPELGPDRVQFGACCCTLTPDSAAKGYALATNEPCVRLQMTASGQLVTPDELRALADYIDEAFPARPLRILREVPTGPALSEFRYTSERFYAAEFGNLSYGGTD